MSNFKWDPEFLDWYSTLTAAGIPTITSPLELRELNHHLVGLLVTQQPIHPQIEQSTHSVTSPDGTPITVTRFATLAHRQSTSPQPAVVYFFGGGLISCNTALWAPLIANYVVDSGVQFFSVDYRLAPEHPVPRVPETCYVEPILTLERDIAPAAVEDAFATVQWLSEHAQELAVDPARICVMGDSGGGGIAAGAALLARDRKLNPPLAKQILIAPMLDDRTSTWFPEPKPFPFWNVENNKMAWAAYVGADKAGLPEADVSPYAAPGRAEDVTGLPSTYIEVGNLELFRDENTTYASRLAAVDTDVEFHIWPGVPHGIELAPNLAATQIAMKSRTRAIKSF
ncbi:hypothetical protein SLS62_003218 [Diatrype stigma]|uniref:Alpha/beta hydrolase fold-3 domain-containing protein n=1 Tax=Diatrype stigma TaxID=117547 RepID=A0AAN9V5G8_9PEZI